ncbi:MAG: phage tail assembly chaperone [bacterium]|nr:phage tail assembly chaperone [bacterium]
MNSFLHFPGDTTKGYLPDEWREITKAGDPALWADFLRWRFTVVRGEKLLDCDWTQLPDAPITPDMQSEWAVYRQQLRDLPASLNFAAMNTEADIPWPPEPV